MRVALAVCAVLSIGFHWAVAPWTVRSGLTLEVRDTEGDIAIPVDLINDEPPPPPAPAPAPQTPESKQEEGPNARDASAPQRRDAGARDAAPPEKDAEPLMTDAGVLAVDQLDATTTDGGSDDSGAIALADAGSGAGGHVDPAGLVGAVGDMQAGDNLVTLVLNVEAIRGHPAGPKLSKLVRAAPQWDDALKGTTVDPVRDADWVMIFGPSLIHTERDTILVHYSVPDAVADEAIEAIKRRSHNGAGFDAGVPGMKATLAHADRAPRVFLRGRTHTIAVVPPDFAHTAAKVLQRGGKPHVIPGEAMRLILKNPNRPIPMIPATVKEMRVKILPLADGGADIFADGECEGAAQAADAAKQINSFVQRYRGSMEGAVANMVSRGLINAIDVTSENNLVRMHAPANREQVDAIIGFVAAQLGVDLGPAPASSAP